MFKTISSSLKTFIDSPSWSAPAEELPFRAEILFRDDIARYAQTLAEGHIGNLAHKKGGNVYTRFRENCIKLEEAYFEFARAAKNNLPLSPGAEWLLDNYHVIEEHVRDIRSHLPRSYYHSLPKLVEGPLAGYPRVYHLAVELLSHTDAIVSWDVLTAFIEEYQQKTLLSIGELWAVPIMLRLGLIENLRRLAVVSMESKSDREEIDTLLDSIVADPSHTGSEALIVLASRLKERPTFSVSSGVHALRRLRSLGSKGWLSLQWLEERLREQGLDPEEIVRNEHQFEAANQISIGNSVTSLKTVSGLNWRSWVEGLSAIDTILRRDPAGVYSVCDFQTRDLYRHRIEKHAKRIKHAEVDVAHAAVTLAERGEITKLPDGSDDLRYRHVGYYLINGGEELLERELGHAPTLPHRVKRVLERHALPLYIGAILALTALVVLEVHTSVLSTDSQSWIATLAAVLFLPAALTVANEVVQWAITRVRTPTTLAKLDFEGGVPARAKTCVTVHAIFHDRESITKAAELLEVRYIGNDDPNIHYALLADLPNADAQTLPEDNALIDCAAEQIRALNEQYGKDRFLLLFRRRLWNDSEQCFMGWERKRGKVTEFNHLLLGNKLTSFEIVVGSAEALRYTRYVITLDGDSQLPRGSAQKLIGTIAHPLNRAIIDPQTNRVVKGYSIIQPRIGVSLTSANVSRFSRTFSGFTGLDPYTHAISDVYQDLFGEGTFVGKGIYEVFSFERVMENRVPENTLLSHDLFESTFARTALATDIELIDDFPSRYNTHSRRGHRWVRGDWQLLPWLLPLVPQADRTLCRNPISSLGKWKIFDNLRRSLLAPTLFLFLALLWATAPVGAAVWSGIAVLIVTVSVWLQLLGSLFVTLGGNALGLYVKSVVREVIRALEQAALHLSFLSYQAYLNVHAIAVTLYRVYVSKQNLLEWQTAYHTERRSGSDLKSFVREFAPALVLTIVLVAVLAVRAPASFLGAAPLLLLWIGSPIIAFRVSQPQTRTAYHLRPEKREYLRSIAWQTWRYFDEHLLPRYHFLIPDNVQLAPERIVAERTSPTNVGLSILSVVSAYDLGFIPVLGALDRLTKIYSTFPRLERFRGHFLNWYQIATLESLRPRYVSTVDSGNMAGHLLAARVALDELKTAPLYCREYHAHLRARLYEGVKLLSPTRLPDIEPRLNGDLLSLLQDVRTLTVELARENSEGYEKFALDLEDFLALEELFSWFTPFQAVCSSLPTAPEFTPLREECLRIASEAHPDTLSLQTTVTLLLRLKGALQRSPLKTSAEFERLRNALSAEVLRGLNTAQEALRRIDHLIEESTRYYEEMDFSFLFDHDRKLFAIGYNVDDARRDNSYYDLLASEARLASLVTIAKGEIPQQHWFMLGRMLADSPGGKALLSWSATMFEYLMPILVTKDYPGTLLSETYRAVVTTQIDYARKRNVPWGVSESAYCGVDFEKTYQYRAFGVPGLGLKRGLSEDLVISPYSTFLALPIAPAEAIENIIALERTGLRGEYGFFESIDYTEERLTKSEVGHIVQSVFGHHQGMTLTSLNNFLNNNIFQERFHADPSIKATELVLHERFPERIPAIVPHQAELSFLEREREAPFGRERKFATPHTLSPEAHILSNSRYSVVIDNEGSGWSFTEKNIALNRWREDSCTNDLGSYIYVRDVDRDLLWSTTYQPTRVEPEYYEAIFNPDKVEFKRQDNGIGLHTEITVSPEDNVEIRRVTVHNLSEHTRNIELTSYSEVVLGSARGDLAHPAFSKMFIESEYLDDLDALLFSRRPRSDHESPLYLIHKLTMAVVWEETQRETNRGRFLGRGRTSMSPLALENGDALSGTTGSVLDPVASLRTRVEIEPGRSVSLSFITLFTRDREEAVNIARRYHEPALINRAFEMAWSQSNVEIRFEHFSLAQTNVFQQLGSAVLFNQPALRADTQTISANRLNQSGLWRFGISGDSPIVLLRINDTAHFPLLREVLLAHDYLKARLFEFDLVILNEYPGGYLQKFQEEIESCIRTGPFGTLNEKSRGVFVRNLHQLSSEEVVLLKAVSRVVLDGSDGPLASQLSGSEASPLSPRPVPRRTLLPSARTHLTLPSLEFFNGVGGFADNGRAYYLSLANSLPPQPWSNVVANKNFGFLITESGGGYTWSDNSRENRLTPWTNDPVSDRGGEVVYIRNTATGHFFSATPLPSPGTGAYEVTHGFGYSSFRTESEKIRSTLLISGAAESKVKWWSVKMTNLSEVSVELESYLHLDLVLGITRQESYRHIVTDFESSGQFLYGINRYNNEFAGSVVFAGCSRELTSYTADRLDFVGRHRDLSSPVALENVSFTGASSLENPVLTGLSTIMGIGKSAPRLSKSVGAGLDPCFTLVTTLTLQPGEEKEVVFYLGEAPSLGDAKAVAKQAQQPRAQASELDQVRHRYSEQCSQFEVKTPDRSFDLLMNGWLLYQTLSCRINGRSALYQSGGAFGFRDQLQDVLALIYANPAMVRDQIVLHASRQFVEGDVQHWWHPPTGRGVRTRISDDYLWLPYVVHRYIEITGDYSVLEVEAPYIDARHLEEHEMEAYLVPSQSQQSGTILHHCLAALNRSLNFGPHGLPLIGGGDWNDGMNEVGREGRGESVWLGWFLAELLKNFSEILEPRNEHTLARRYREHSAQLVSAIEERAWDGAWYRRAYFDDGTPLGSAAGEECQIDSLAQTWSVITGLGNEHRQHEAMEAVYERLVDSKHRIIKLLTPPFNTMKKDPGYIKGYLPGIRENGGQYTHAATWVVLATAKLGRGKLAYDLFSMLNPITHTTSPEGVTRYKGEPYVLCGDVYSVSPHEGHAGWSWYTGSSGWLFRVGLEGILGFTLHSGTAFTIDPCVPPSWSEFTLRFTLRGSRYEVKVLNPTGVERGVKEIHLDGKTVTEARIPVQENRRELTTVKVVMG